MDSKKTETKPQQSSPSKNATEKVIFINICKNCSKHNLSTWHDEAKYKKMFLDLKTCIEKECPEVQVYPTSDDQFKLGACEVIHGEKLLYSKIKSGLWPNAPAVGKRVAAYFKDLDAGKDVSVYTAGAEQKYVAPKKPGTAFGGTRSRYMNSTHRSTDAVSPDTRFFPKADDHEHGGDHHSHENKITEKGDDPFEFEDHGKKEEPVHDEPPKKDHHETNHKAHHEEPKVAEHKTPKHEEIQKSVTPKKEELPKEEHHEPKKDATPKHEAPHHEAKAHEEKHKTENETEQGEKVEEEVKGEEA